MGPHRARGRGERPGPLGPELQRAGVPLSDHDERASEPEAEVWIVDRIDDGVAVLILDGPGDDPVISEVDSALLGSQAGRGAVLEVPLGSVGEPVWEDAVVVEE